MTAAIVLEPHADDAVLFSAFNAIRYEALVVTVLSSAVQEARGTGITQAVRLVETMNALAELGVTGVQWPYPDVAPDWAAIQEALMILDERLAPERVFAPAVEPGGHDHHNRLGALADEVFGAGRVAHYLTYTIDGKSTNGVSVLFEPAWVTLKLRALACHRSQIETAAAGCTEHFVRDQHEYIAA